METPVTNAKLEKMLTAYKKAKHLPSGVLVGGKSTDQKPVPMKIKIASLQSIETYFQKKVGMYAKSDLQKYLDELKTLTSLIEQQIEKVPETAPVKPVKRPAPQI